MFLLFYFRLLFDTQIKIAWNYLEKCDLRYIRLDWSKGSKVVLIDLQLFCLYKCMIFKAAGNILLDAAQLAHNGEWSADISHPALVCADTGPSVHTV